MNQNEEQYLRALEQVLREGERRETRNGTTLSKFGIHIEMDISESFPLLTSKKMFFKGIVAELLWFLQGKTNAQWLQERGVHIWDGNSTRGFLDSRGLTDYPEGECGPIYGFQWRNFGGTWSTDGHLLDGKDQWQQCVDLIRNDPTSRRIFMSAWNPLQLDAMALPPCHVSYQFYVSEHTNQLSCSMYQRSGDMFLGVPFNIASTALLTYLMAKITGRQVGKILITIGDAHIYESHTPAVELQLSRREALHPFPQLVISSREGINVDDVSTFNIEDFQIQNYVSHPLIKAAMVA